MASKRMINVSVVDSDAFLSLPQTAQNLYFHLNMRADDDGFVDSPKKIMRIIGASDGDMQSLLQKRYLLIFESGVIVIKHWRMHNYIAKDRYKPTVYQEEMKTLELKKNNTYTEKKTLNNGLISGDLDFCIQNDNKMDTQIRLDKIRLDKNSKDIVEQNSTIPYSDIINHLNEKAGTRYKSTTKKTQSLIKARFNEGFTLDDFKTVIDKKTIEWKYDSKMSAYLRPETLFGTKFESYLNQTVTRKGKPKIERQAPTEKVDAPDLDKQKEELQKVLATYR